MSIGYNAGRNNTTVDVETRYTSCMDFEGNQRDCLRHNMLHQSRLIYDKSAGEWSADLGQGHITALQDPSGCIRFISLPFQNGHGPPSTCLLRRRARASRVTNVSVSTDRRRLGVLRQAGGVLHLTAFCQFKSDAIEDFLAGLN